MSCGYGCALRPCAFELKHPAFDPFVIESLLLLYFPTMNPMEIHMQELLICGHFFFK